MTQIQGSRILSAALSAEGNVCGDVAGSAETVSIDGFEIPAILGKTQTADLRAGVGGDACLDLSVADNRLTTTLKTTPLPPSPTPSLTPTPTPSPAPAATPSAAVSASPSPSPSPTPVVPAVVTADPTSGDAPPIVPLVLLVLTAGALGIVGSFLVRRYRRYRGGPVPLTAGPPDVPDRPG
jgi:hypothetical protein